LQSLHAQNLTQIENVFTCSKHSNFENGQPYFFQTSFFSTKCAQFFQTLQRILTLMMRREKGFELMKIVFTTDLNTFGSKVLLTLKIMDFENVFLSKVIHVYVIEGMDA